MNSNAEQTGDANNIKNKNYFHVKRKRPTHVINNIIDCYLLSLGPSVTRPETDGGSVAVGYFRLKHQPAQPYVESSFSLRRQTCALAARITDQRDPLESLSDRFFSYFVVLFNFSHFYFLYTFFFFVIVLLNINCKPVTTILN